MSHDLETGSLSLADVIELVLAKGLMVDSWARISLVGADIVAIDARALVSSFDALPRCRPGAGTYLTKATESWGA